MNEDGQKTVQDNYDEIFEINTAIVEFARKKVLDLRGLAELHRLAADKYDQAADSVAEMSLQSAELIARGIAVEAGLFVPDDEEEAEDDE